MRRALLACAAALLLAGCGGGGGDADRAANAKLLDAIPAYPGFGHGKTTHVHEGDTTFAARDWELPDAATAQTVIEHYRVELQQRGWQIDGFSVMSLSAVKGDASIDLGVRGDTVEMIARAR